MNIYVYLKMPHAEEAKWDDHTRKQMARLMSSNLPLPAQRKLMEQGIKEDQKAKELGVPFKDWSIPKLSKGRMLAREVLDFFLVAAIWIGLVNALWKYGPDLLRAPAGKMPVGFSLVLECAVAWGMMKGLLALRAWPMNGAWRWIGCGGLFVLYLASLYVVRMIPGAAEVPVLVILGSCLLLGVFGWWVCRLVFDVPIDVKN